MAHFRILGKRPRLPALVGVCMRLRHCKIALVQLQSANFRAQSPLPNFPYPKFFSGDLVCNRGDWFEISAVRKQADDSAEFYHFAWRLRGHHAWRRFRAPHRPGRLDRVLSHTDGIVRLYLQEILTAARAHPLELSRVVWLRPELGAEVAYSNWRDDWLSRHPG